MSVLMRASEIIKRPVVTMAGEDIAQIKDILYGAGGGRVSGFTLNGRGILAGPLSTALAWKAIHAVGPDAVMIDDESSLGDLDRLLADTGSDTSAGGGNVLNSRVLTDDGVDLGVVVDVIVNVSGAEAGHAEVVGYEIEPSEAIGHDQTKVLIPRPDTIAASGANLMVPAATRDFVARDLAGFGASIEAFHRQLDATR
jgi:sporulation protein YlmC with PRC-barrel domain